MVLLKDTYKAQFFTTVDEISDGLWIKLKKTKSIYFTYNYLKSLSYYHPRLSFFYIALFNLKDELVLFSTLQLLDFDIDNVKNNSNPPIDKLHKIAIKLNLLSDKKSFKILTFGNVFISGQHGVYLDSKYNKDAYFSKLIDSSVYFFREGIKLKKDVQVFMLKDFYDDSLSMSNTLHNYSYYSFKVDPNMSLQLDDDWNVFSDYLFAMKTKFRVKAKKAFELSSSLEILNLDNNSLDFYIADIKKLYSDVSTNASFNLAHYNIDIFKVLKDNFGDNFIIKVYLLDSKLVGFLSGLVNNKELDAHYVGLDYKFNKSHAVYQRILYDYIAIAIDNNLSKVNFGRTASEIKSSVGAKPENLTIYIKHKNRLANKGLKLIVDKIKPTPFSEKSPFKEKVEN